jgi:hypothetical protein
MRPPRVVPPIAVAILFCVGLGLAAGAEPPQPRERVELIPSEAVGWSWTRLFAPLTRLFSGGSGYWYAPRAIEIDTDPPGALLELHYLRDNFQKAYERVEAPASVLLPSRIKAAAGDAVAIRAHLDGYRQQEARAEVRSRIVRVQIALTPLPNALAAFAHRYFGGRGSLIFSTREPPDFRLQTRPGGMRVLLLGTRIESAARAALDASRSSLVESLSARQIGEDLVVTVAFAAGAQAASLEPRSRRWRDPLRELHVISIDLVPEDGGAADIARMRDLLSRMQPTQVTGCALAFEVQLRGELDPEALERASAPDGSYRDRFTRAALKRLGELSPGGVIQLGDGSRLRGWLPLELEAAALRAGSAVGYLALLRSVVEGLEPEPLRRPVLRGLIAPGLPAARFGEILDAAERRERACHGRSARRTTAPAPSPAL